ncbi:hypothetical protein DPMN_035698 [Dreissena polymorpha]|uniref:Uncharacterized protein n=1 Tax=Dreissena polymorpha TaxID=45954 RepID=A0A9D4M7S9_DREPO|nr:hypothetical protein DPMN_035698 [Dreissena polymorpha]
MVINGGTKKFKEMFHTRWLSFEGAVDAIIANYQSLVSVFLEETASKALSLHKPIATFKLLYVSHFLDCLEPLAIPSKSFQKQDLNFAEVHPLLTGTIDSLAKLKDGKSGDKLSKCLSQVPSEPRIDGLCIFEFQGHTIRDGVNHRQEASSVCVKFVDNMLKSLNEGFSDNDDLAILTALTNLFSP